MDVFIDANVFLSFYHLTGDDLEEMRKILALIENKQVTLWLPEQVRCEVFRNREVKIADALKQFRDTKLKMTFPRMCMDYPEYKDLQRILTELENKHNQLLRLVQESAKQQKLRADELLKKLFEKAHGISTTDAIILAAKRRVVKGDPPGKDKGHGDAINWESLLDKVPVLTDLTIISLDGDYRSALDATEPKDALAKEWEKKKAGSLRLFQRISEWAAKDFPGIKLAEEVERDLAVKAFVSSGSFLATHSAVAKLDNYFEFSSEQLDAIVDAALTNNQISWIIKDPDVSGFMTQIMGWYTDEHCSEKVKSLRAALGLEDEAAPSEDAAVSF